jgi:hypothetical protein
MFQHLFGKWKVWQVCVLVALVVGIVAVTATIVVASPAGEGPASMTTRSHAAPCVAGPNESIRPWHSAVPVTVNRGEDGHGV